MIYTCARRAHHVRSDTKLLKQLSRARLIWLGVIVLIAAFFLYRYMAGSDGAPEYQTAVAERGNVVSRVSTSGSMQAVVTVDVGSQVSGRVQELYADFNSPVKKGEKIAKIDPALFGAAVVQAEANVMAARANVSRLAITAEDAERQAKRASEVYEKQLISATERDNAVADVVNRFHRMHAAVGKRGTESCLRHNTHFLAASRQAVERIVAVGSG